MKHLMNRDEYVSKVNEGVIGNAFRAGVRKLKSMFSILIKKIKNFIAIFDNEGNVLPVVSTQAALDHFGEMSGVTVCSSRDMSDSIVAAGGKGCGTTANELPDEDSYEDVDEDSVEYKNFMHLSEVLKESFGVDIDMQELNERSSYSKPGAKLNVPVIDSVEFEELLMERIFEKHGAYDDDDDDDFTAEHRGNLLIFGAPGIGKSSIANTVIKKYNEGKSAANSVSLISINCANLSPGDFMMPTIPMKKDISSYIERNKEDIPEFASVDNLSDEDKSELATALRQQKVSDTSPKTWLPCYKPSGNPDIDAVLDAAANGAITRNKRDARKNVETGSGGIILFDELFRADPAIFNQLMTFLLNREMDGWQLGSKWAIVACSNRPADSARVSDTWQEIEGADLDRYCQIALLKPSPEGWKNYMRKRGLDGENEILFKFIFDPDSMDGDEYTRWHRVDSKVDMENDNTEGNEKSEANSIPVTPRRWEEVWRELKKYMKKNNLNSVLQISTNQLHDVLKLYFTPDFLNEFVDWMDAHTGNVDIEEIIKDPTNVFPRKDGRTDDAVIIRDLWEQFEKKYTKVTKDKNGKVTKRETLFVPDEEISNVFLWLGIHMRNQANLVNTDFFQLLDKVMENDTDNSVDKKPKMIQTLMAAWPESNDIETEKKENPESYEEILKMMKEYFPWRLKDGEIQYINMFEDGDE